MELNLINGLMMDGRKRRRSEEVSEAFMAKRFHVVTLAPEPDKLADSDDSESDCSIQYADTASPTDTSDTGTKSSVSEPELSPMSLSASDLNGSSSDSSYYGDPGAIINVVFDVESNISWADDSDTKSCDPEIPKADYWQCVCGCKKNSPVGPLCEKCFQRRKQTILPRPKRKKKLKLKKSSIQKDTPGPTTLTPEPSTSSSQDSGVSGGEVQDLCCNGCRSAPIDAAFYHTNSAHMWGCYACSKRAWKSKRRCPVCLGISRVIRLYRS